VRRAPFALLVFVVASAIAKSTARHHRFSMMSSSSLRWITR